MEYEWKLKSLKKTNDGGVVVQTYWEVIGTDDDGYSGKFEGATPFNLDEVDPETFIPYDQLTQEIVLGWIQEIVTNTYMQMVDKMILRDIQRQKDDIIETSEFPWSQPEEPTQE